MLNTNLIMEGQAGNTGIPFQPWKPWGYLGLGVQHW